ncbi:MAG: sporulation integral membrane protein YtvI [Clostridia bacterium]|nr:sporulation integral membrane protein YtvI [Clostridia bacterium]
MEQRELSWHDRGRLWMRLGIRTVLFAAVILGLIFLAPPLLSLFMPFVLAFVMAWLLHPVIRALQKRLKLSRGILSMLLIVLVFAIAGGALGFFCYSAVVEVRSLAENWQSVWQSAQSAILAIGETLDKWLAYLPAELEDMVNEGLRNLTAWVQTVLPNALASMASRAGNFAMSIPSFAISSIMFIMAAYFITADYPRIRFMVTDRLPEGFKGFLSHVKKTAMGAFGGYVRAQVILSLGVFAILLVGFLLIGQDYALLLAILLAVLDFIPIIGSGTAMVPWAVVDLITGNYVHAVGLMAVWGVISLFRRVGEPKIVGDQTGLSPILSLVSIYVGMRLGGVFGMILGPVLCLVVINLSRAGLFEGLLIDLRLAVNDTSALLRNRPPQAEQDGAPETCSKNTHDSFKKD